jgi:Holliday junction DNA helicase RuvB
LGSLSNPLRNRFGATHRLEFYNQAEIEKIIQRSSRILGVEMEGSGLSKIASCARCTPRVANRLLKRVRDFSQIKNHKSVDSIIAQAAMEMIDVDHIGLEPADRHILKTVIEKFKGGPVGLATIAAATAEEIKTIEDVYEPYLIQIGFLARTPRGRVVTENAYQHLGIPYPKQENLL